MKPKTTNNSPTKMDTGSTSDEYAPSTLPSRRRRPDVLRLYIAFVVFALMHCGVLEVLVTLGSASDRLVAARAGEPYASCFSSLLQTRCCLKHCE